MRVMLLGRAALPACAKALCMMATLNRHKNIFFIK